MNTPAGGAARPGDDAAPALHNVYRVGERVISGAVPEGDAAFDELTRLGVRTIISVDGATPDLGRAAARGMRYVHIPVTYATVAERERLEIARAIRDLPGPVYVHCHHGKHRGPAAAAAALVTLGEITPEAGVGFMKTAGTAPQYSGLYRCVADADAASPAAIDTASAEFPSVRRAHGLVAAMVEVDQASERLSEVRAAGWQIPDAHPDLVPGAEAGRLTDNLRFSAEDPHAREHGEEFMQQLRESIALASALEESIVRADPAPELEARWSLVIASCKSCHATYRDRTR